MIEAEIPEHLSRLINIEGFTQAFTEMLSYYINQPDAYEAVERQFMRAYGQRKYADFESFRQCRNRYYKSLSKKNVK